MNCGYLEKKLKYVLVVLALKERYSDIEIKNEIETWGKYLEAAGIRCILKDMDTLMVRSEKKTGTTFWTEYFSDDTLVLTDNRELSKIFSENGYVCIGLDTFMESFFDGAEAVVSSIEDLDCRYMTETFLRAKGVPVLIAQTERIRIREISKKDIPLLYEISRQDGMEYAFADPEQAECFECSRMEAYIATVYRFYGYGLWAAETLQGELIGCCGLSDWVMADDETANDKGAYDIERDTYTVMYMGDYASACEECRGHVFEQILELQYFVANRFQNQGYGTEMCRAVISYAQERLAEYKICVRVYPQNTASVKLAEKLGFQKFRR